MTRMDGPMYELFKASHLDDLAMKKGASVDRDDGY